MKIKPTIKATRRDTFADLIAAARKQSGKTLREVESVTGLSNAQISLIESGKIKSPSASSVFTLARFYRLGLKEVAGCFEELK